MGRWRIVLYIPFEPPDADITSAIRDITFHPDKPDQMVLHIDDDTLEFDKARHHFQCMCDFQYNHIERVMLISSIRQDPKKGRHLTLVAKS